MSYQTSALLRRSVSVDHRPMNAPDARERLHRLVSETDRRLSDDDIQGMDDFVVGLNTIRQSVTADDWHSLIEQVVVPHPVRPRIHQEPFTRRAFQKPRGYPGDAALLDLIYRDRPISEQLTPLGARLHAWTEHHAGCVSVRERRAILAGLIDQAAAERSNPRILSLACGHLREGQSAGAVKARQIEELIAIDQDVESLAVVDREQRANHVTPVHSTVARFMARPATLGTFDLAYSAGLYDYLADTVASALTAAMFSVLRPGGRLVVANVTPDLPEIGYMDAIMDWRLLYRVEAEVARFTSMIPAADIAETSLTRDSGGNVIYLSVRKG